MFINSALYNKFMRVECSVCEESEVMTFSIMRPEMYDPKDDDLITITYESFIRTGLIERLKILKNLKKFNKKCISQEDPFIELNLSKYQLEDMRDTLFDVVSEFEFDEFEDKFEEYLNLYKSIKIKKFQQSDTEKVYRTFKSSDGLQLLINENPDFHSDPIKLAFSLNDPDFISKDELKKAIKNYLFHKEWKFPLDRAYFSLTLDEAIRLIAAATFMLNDENIIFFSVEEDEDDDERMGK